MSATIVTHSRLEPAVVGETPTVQALGRLAGLVDRLACPATGRKLTLSADGQSLLAESVSYPVRDGLPLMLQGEALARARAWQPDARRSTRRRIWSLVPSPVSGRRQRRYLTRFLSTCRPGELIVNVGSGGWDLGPEVVNLDVLPHHGVDLCGDIHRLPFGAGEVDALICTGVLEHIADPVAAVAELRRVLRPGGAVFCTVPFLQAYHEDPADYRRYTVTGLRQLFADFESLRIRPSHGVGSALAWVAADALAALLACNVNRLHTAWLMLLRCVFAPLRLLDRFSEGSRFEHLACCGLLVEATR